MRYKLKKRGLRGISPLRGGSNPTRCILNDLAILSKNGDPDECTHYTCNYAQTQDMKSTIFLELAWGVPFRSNPLMLTLEIMTSM